MAVRSENNPVLGFDLGTTFSAVSKWIDGKGPRIIANKFGQDTTQSAVYIDPKTDEVLVGQTAFNKGLMYPENMIVGVKRLIDDGRKILKIAGKEFTPIDISSMILKNMYKDVQSKYPKGFFETRGSVVTVPFYFKAHQIENTRNAAEMADINCIGIIQEPIAASLLYAYQLCEENPEAEISQNILVFDLGGGTFDLTLFHLESDKKSLRFEVLGTGGDDRLGGMDFDNCLSKVILEKSNVSLEGLEPSEFNKANSKLMDQTINTKIALAAANDYFVAIPFILGETHIQQNICRVDFNNCIAGYLDKVVGIIDGLWAQAGIRPSDVDRVLKVGGSSAIPKIKELLDETMGDDKVWADVNPSTSISEGAAMYSAFLDDREFFNKEIEITTRTCHALGLKLAGNEFDIIIPSNRKTPCEVKRYFANDKDDMTSLKIDVYQGSGKIIKDNSHSHIGSIPITNLPKKKAGELDIEVTFKVSEEQRLSVNIVVEGQRISKTLDFT